VYIRGQFVGGSDIVRELAERGELAKLIKGETS
jgi:glutaredoxin-related protein